MQRRVLAITYLTILSTLLRHRVQDCLQVFTSSPVKALMKLLIKSAILRRNLAISYRFESSQ